jgi:hypothetical protein
MNDTESKNNGVNFTNSKGQGELGVLTSNSPSGQKRILQHKMDIEDERYANTWTSCCITLDRRAVQYFTQIIMIGGTMAFSISQLYRHESCENQQAYLGLLTMLIGLLMPSPKFNGG